MKYLRVLVLAALVAGGALNAPAGCLNMYNNELRGCDANACTIGPFTCAGCYADALVDYYSCVEQQAVA